MMAENKNILDVCITYASTDLAWSQSKITNFIAFFGVCWVTGSLGAKKFIERFGIRRFTTGSNIMAALGFLCWAGVPSGGGLWVGTFLLMFGLERRQGVLALVNDLGVERGLGAGQIASMVANYKAATLVVAPLMVSGRPCTTRQQH
jgi:hypothetical protein